MTIDSPKRIVVILTALVIGVSIFLSTDAKAQGFADAISRAGGLQGRAMWCDAEANLEYLSTRNGVAEVARLCKEVGINTIIVDVKPLNGYVLYNSKVAPHMSSRPGKTYPKGYDLLKVMVEEGHKQGLKVHAAINVFAEASQNLRQGTAFDHPDWQCINYERDYWVIAASGGGYPIAGVDKAADFARLYLYIKNPAAALEADTSYRILVDDQGLVLAVYPVGQIADMMAPEGARVLTGSGTVIEWLTGNIKQGDTINLQVKAGFVPVAKSADEHLAVFLNPANRDVRDYEISIVKEISANYDIDGLVLDRMRYPNIYADFSDLSREKFEAWMGLKVEAWPEDIFQRPLGDGDIKRGKYFSQWLEWRALQIKEFLEEARTVFKSEKPDAILGVYVGSWYSEYYGVGVNWASPRHIPAQGWASKTYNTTGYANMIDYLCTGCYYPIATREEARALGKPEESTVEAAAQVSNRVVMDDTFVYASLYLLDYNNKPEEFVKAIQACLAHSQGVMLFDLVYARKYQWWDLLKQALGQPVKAPHDVPGLIEKVHEVRQFVESHIND